MRKTVFLISFLLITALTGFGQPQSGPDLNSSGVLSSISFLKGYYSQELGYEIDTIHNLNLYNTVTDWLSTRYRYGGKNRKGIDCSSFVRMVYDGAYQVNLSQSSGAMFSSDVVPLEKEELQEGDLVFFKIRRKRISHVGIYLGKNKFAHASRGSGVVVSDLDEPYYKKYYFKGGRYKGLTNIEKNEQHSNANTQQSSD